MQESRCVISETVCGTHPSESPTGFPIVRRTQRVDIERVGLGDYIAPPSTVQVLYNNLKCPKSVKFVQGSNHGYVPPEEYAGRDFWLGKRP